MELKAYHSSIKPHRRANSPGFRFEPRHLCREERFYALDSGLNFLGKPLTPDFSGGAGGTGKARILYVRFATETMPA